MKFALGFFFAAPVLEDARSLLDKRAALFRPGFKNLSQLALADDNMHFAADATVRQQFLDVHQPGLGPVDLIFAGPIPVHTPGY